MGLNHQMASLSCALGEAFATKRTLLLPDRICLFALHTQRWSGGGAPGEPTVPRRMDGCMGGGAGERVQRLGHHPLQRTPLSDLHRVHVVRRKLQLLRRTVAGTATRTPHQLAHRVRFH